MKHFSAFFINASLITLGAFLTFTSTSQILNNQINTATRPHEILYDGIGDGENNDNPAEVEYTVREYYNEADLWEDPICNHHVTIGPDYTFYGLEVPYSYAYNLNTNMDFNETVTVEFEAWENDTLQCTYESDRDDDYFLGYPTWTNSSGSDGFTSFTGGGTYLPSRWRFNHNTNNLDNWLFPISSTWNFKYATAWRYTNGEADSPLDFGTVPANNFRTHLNSNVSIIDDTHPWSNDLLSYPFAEVWYSFTITEEMPVVISTVNNTTNYDTALALYENSIAPENFILSNQDQFPDVLQAEISTTLPAGYYIIRVTEEDFPLVSGKFELTITTGNPIVSVEENDLSNELSVFPNPAQEVVTIGLGESFKSARIDLVNTLGQVVYSTSIVDEKSIQFAVDQFDSGIYTLVVSDKNNVAKKQLVLK